MWRGCVHNNRGSAACVVNNTPGTTRDSQPLVTSGHTSKTKESHLPNGLSSHMPIVCQLAFFPFRAPGLPHGHGQWTLLSKFAPFATITKSLMKTKRARQTSQCPEGLQKGREGRLKGSSSETLILRHFVEQAISPSSHLIHT